MKNLRFIVLVALMCAGFSAKAELVNNTDGYNRAFVNYSRMKLIYDEGADNHNGFDAGVLHGFCIGRSLPIFFEIGLQVGYDRFNWDTEISQQLGIQNYRNLVNMAIPVNFTYRFEFDNGFYLAPYGGAKLKFNLYGKESIYDQLGEGITINLFEEDNGKYDTPWKRLQFGGQLGINMGWKRLNFHFGYHWDGKICADPKYKTRGFVAGMGINF